MEGGGQSNSCSTAQTQACFNYSYTRTSGKMEGEQRDSKAGERSQGFISHRTMEEWKTWCCLLRTACVQYRLHRSIENSMAEQIVVITQVIICLRQGKHLTNIKMLLFFLLLSINCSTGWPLSPKFCVFSVHEVLKLFVYYEKQRTPFSQHLSAPV